MKPGKIRVLALGLILHHDRILVAEGFDTEKHDHFYRVLGGGVDFGETSLEALKREFQEELQAELTHIKYLDCLENIFTYNGQPGHEIIQLYQCDFVDPTFYSRDQITYEESDAHHQALWIACDRFRSGELRLVPEGFLRFL